MKPLKKTLKQLAVVVMVLTITIPVKGQWSNGTDIYNTNAGNVGIGTPPAPGAKLHVYSNGGSTQIRSEGGTGMYGYFRSQSGTTYWDLATRDSDYGGAFQIRSQGGSPQVVVNPNGNVGIGTGGPAIPSGRGLSIVSPATTGHAGISLKSTDGGYEWDLLSAAQGYFTVFQNGVGGGDRLTISTTGNVGISTTGPNAKLDVRGKAIIGDGVTMPSSPGEFAITSSASVPTISWHGNSGNLYTQISANGVNNVWTFDNQLATGGPIRFAQDGTVRMSIDIGGNVGIGTTTPEQTLDVNGTITGGIAAGGMYIIPAARSNGNLAVAARGTGGGIYLNYAGSSGNGGIKIYDGSTTQIGVWQSNGYVGIGTTGPSSLLEISGASTGNLVGERIVNTNTTNGNTAQISFRTQDIAGTYLDYGVIRGIFVDHTDGIETGALAFLTRGGPTTINEQMRISSSGGLSLGTSYVGTDPGTGSMIISGNVGIGTTTVTEKLTVNGKILAEEVQVVLNVQPDYVFKEDYKLMSLAELDKFIKTNKHLPEVPSEKEVCDNGSKIGLGEMNHILLKKIEELTLYTIDQENNIKEQKENSEKQDEVIKELLKQNETILKRVTELEKQ